MSITQILLEKGLLAPEQMDEAIALQKAEGLRLDRAIIQLGFLTELQLLEVMSEQLHLPLVNLADVTIDPQTLRALPPKIVYRKRLVPISRLSVPWSNSIRKSSPLFKSEPGIPNEDPGAFAAPGPGSEIRLHHLRQRTSHG